MKKVYRIAFLCAALIFCLLSGCSANNEKVTVQLTEEQETKIDLIVQNRDEWKKTIYITAYPVNRLHISEIDGGITILTVANVTTGADGWQTFVGVKGYAVTDNKFMAIESYHKDWLANSTSVDLESMSDEGLREAVEQSYIDFLSKK